MALFGPFGALLLHVLPHVSQYEASTNMVSTSRSSSFSFFDDDACDHSQQRIINVNTAIRLFRDPAAMAAARSIGSILHVSRAPTTKVDRFVMATENAISNSLRTGAAIGAAAAQIASETDAGLLASIVTISPSFNACKVQWPGLAANNASCGAKSATR